MRTYRERLLRCPDPHIHEILRPLLIYDWNPIHRRQHLTVLCRVHDLFPLEQAQFRLGRLMQL